MSPTPRISLYLCPEKVQAEPNAKKLKPENIGWDVTVGVDQHSPGKLPLVFFDRLQSGLSGGRFCNLGWI